MRIKLDDGIVIDTKQLKYMGADVDRHDNVRVFVRRQGRKSRIRDWSSLEAFMAEYRALLSGPLNTATVKATAPSSLRWLCERYYGSAEFHMLEESTRKVRRRLLDALCEQHGSKPFKRLEKRHVRDMRDAKVAAGTPEAGNDLVKVLRSFFSWAVDAEHAEHNPAKDIPRINTGSQGHHTWTVEEVHQFEDRHPVGSKARLAMSLMLFTGTRASDAIRLGPQMERDGTTKDGTSIRRLHFTEWKYRKRSPKVRAIPILPELREIINATPSGHLGYIVTEHGKPYSSGNSFGQWFKRQCIMADLPHCTAHGLRKSGATIAAQKPDANPHILNAIYGWTTLKQAEGYTRAVNNMRLADEHMHLIVPERKEDKVVPLSNAVSSGGTLRSEKS